ncbi:hypothetical protein E2320_012765 [Naja naja]|nr:hypothetical protein E2320_012765 [Naja naja]
MIRIPREAARLAPRPPFRTTAPRVLRGEHGLAMAAPGPEASDGDSEEEAAAWQRLREAAWDPVLGRAAALDPVENSRKRNQQAGGSSIREKIRNHEQDGNELQTTPEFRAHVAKKLDTILDNGLESDSEWQRCQEVAVTAADILKQSGLPPPAAQDSGQTIEAVWKKVKKKKKKKKKKGKREENGQPEAIEAVGNSQNKELSCPSSPEAISWTETMQRKRKRKRKRKTEAGTE